MYIHCSNREPTPPPSWHDAFLFYRRKLGCQILWWSQPTELGVGVGDRELPSRSSWTVEAIHFCMHFKSSPYPYPAVGRVCRQLCYSCRFASFFFTSRQHTYCADQTGSTNCTVYSLLALLNRNKQVPFRDFCVACSSQSVKILSDPNTNTNSFDRIEIC